MLSLALLFAALVAFTYLGYPALAWVLSRLVPAPVKRHRFFPFLTVILPVHNEGRRLVAKVENLLAQEYPLDRLRIIIVNDGGDDGFPEGVRLDHPDNVVLLTFPRRFGKASALNAALSVASSEIVLFTDARQRLVPGALASLVRNFADPSVSAVTGRLVSGDDGPEGLFRRYEESVRFWEAQWGSCAGATGALYAVRRLAATRIPAGTILDDLVMSLCAASRGRLVYEPRAAVIEPPESPRKTWKRRLRTLAGNWQIVFHPVTYRKILSRKTVLQLVCHKLLRLLVPFFFAAFLSALLAATTWAVLVRAIAVAFPAFVIALILRRSLATSFLRAAASLFVAPVESLIRYCLGRETALWAKP